MTTTCLLFVSAAMLGQLPASDLPTAHELIKKMSILDCQNGDCRSLELVGWIKQPGEVNLKFRAVARGPWQSSLLVCDGSDNTPLLYVVDRQMLIYDPVGPVVFRSNSTRFLLTIQTKEDVSTILMGVSTDNLPGRISFDLKSLLNQTAETEEVVPTGKMTYRLTRTTAEGDRSVIHFDLGRPCPVTHFESFTVGAKEPNLVFERIILNGEINDEEFVFPDEKSLAETITVKELPADNVLATLGGLMAAVRATYVRFAAHQPAVRNRLKFPGLLGINWERVQEHDAKYAEAMRKLIPLAQRSGLAPSIPEVRPENFFKPRFLKEGLISGQP